METLQVLGLGSLELGVSGVSFSVLNKGAYVSAVDCSREKVLHMWEWRTSELLSKVSVDADLISGVSFHPFDNNLVITHGKSHLAFWNRKKDGFFARADLGETGPVYQCLTYLESGDVVAGDSSGSIITLIIIIIIQDHHCLVTPGLCLLSLFHLDCNLDSNINVRSVVMSCNPSN